MASDIGFLPFESFLILLICSFGVVTNLLTVVVFWHRKFRRQIIFKCLLIKSLAQLVYLSINLASVFFTCGLKCFNQLSSIYGIVISLYLNNFLASSLVIFILLVEIYVSIQRLLLVLANRRAFIWYKQTLVTLFVLTILLKVPYLMSIDVYSFNLNETTTNMTSKRYWYRSTGFAATQTYAILAIGPKWLRVFLACVVLLALNVAIALKLRSKQSNKENNTEPVVYLVSMESGQYLVHIGSQSATAATLESEQQRRRAVESRQITIMILLFSVILMLAHVPYCIYFIASYFILVDQQLINYSYYILYLIHGSSFFVFLFFSKRFRKTLKHYLLFIRRRGSKSSNEEEVHQTILEDENL